MSVIGHGVEICTAATRPASPAAGTIIYQEDTNQLYVWNGFAWMNPITNHPAGGGLSGTYPSPSIASPMLANHFAWGSASTNFPSGVSNSAAVTLNVPFKSSVLARFILTGYVTYLGLFTQYARIDGVTGWYNIGHYYHNTTYDHRTYPAGVIGITLNPGNYVFRAYTAGASTDSGDRLNVSIVCRAVA